MNLNPTSKVRVNGFISDKFVLKRGTRQGCPLSPLFAISIEPLAELIREDHRVQGVTVGGTEFKLSLYADDVILYISNPLTSVPALLECLREFELVSGYKVNETKSQALSLVGDKPKELDKIASFNWPTRGFRYLGVVITPHASQLYNENYGKLMSKIKADVGRWDIHVFNRQNRSCKHEHSSSSFVSFPGLAYMDTSICV